MPLTDPFPLNILEKQDSWEKTQQMANVPEDYKYTAPEFNLLLKALQFLYESGSGPAAWGSIVNDIYLQEDLIELISSGSSKPIENRYVAAPDNTLVTMFADQANQTTGFIQLVGDASADPDVVSGKAYYEKKASNTGSLSDYERLSDNQSALIESSFNYLIKRVAAKGSAIVNLDPMDVNSMAVLVNPNSPNAIRAFIFESSYSKYLAKSVALFNAGKPVTLSFANVTRSTNIVAKVSSFDTYEDTDYVIANIETTGDYKVPFNTIGQGDVLHLFLPNLVGGASAQTLDQVLNEGNTSDTDISLENGASYMVSDPTDLDRFVKMCISQGFRGLLEFHEGGLKTTLLANKPNSNRVVRLPNLTATLIGKINNKLADLDGVLTLYQGNIKDKVQLELTASGTLTVDYSTDNTVAYIFQSDDLAISVTPPTLGTAESKTVFLYIIPDGNTTSLPTDITDNMLGDFDDFSSKYRLVITYIRIDGSTLINTSTLTAI